MALDDDGVMTTEICFMAGESAERSWRHVVPFLPRDALATYHELGAALGGTRLYVAGRGRWAFGRTSR